MRILNKKFITSLLAMLLLLSFCKRKQKEPKIEVVNTNTSAPTTTTSPTYTQNSTGTGGNPNVPNQTVTGTATLTNPATQNSSLLVGGSGWSYPTCISTNSVTLKALNGNIEVTLNFLFPPASGTYAIAGSPNSQACAMTVLNAPNQPSGIVWYAKTGQVVVSTTTAAINASFSGILCTQQNFNFPTVGLTGTMECN